MNKNLINLTAFGIFWSGISQFSTQFFQFIIIVFLARLLSPQEFGTVGLALVFMEFFISINELGLIATIIQRKDLDEIYLSTSFWASVGMGMILFILTILVSPFIANFFQIDILRPILIVSSTGLIIGSFGVVQRALFEKKLDFKILTISDVFSGLTFGIVSILLAINGFGVWSLVFGSIVRIFISVIILWMKSSWRPLLKFSIPHFKDLFDFGGHVMGSQILDDIVSRLDYIIVGKFLGSISLGLYTFAINLVTFPLQRISWMVLRVVFPAFSIIQENNQALREGYIKILRYISLVTFPLIAGLFLTAQEFIVVVFGIKWIPMIIPLQILCIAGAARSVSTTVGTILYSKGRADIQLKWKVVTAFVMPIALIIGAKYGLNGIAIAVTSTAVVFLLIIQTITNRLIGLKMSEYFKSVFPALFSSIILIVIGSIFKNILSIYNVQDMTMLLGSIIIGIIVYILSIKLLFNNIFKELRVLVNEIRN